MTFISKSCILSLSQVNSDNLKTMNNTLITIEKLGQLATIVEEQGDFNIYDIAVIASMFNDIDEAINVLDEDNFYHGECADIMVVDEAHLKNFEIYELIFKWFARVIIDLRTYHEDMFKHSFDGCLALNEKHDEALNEVLSRIMFNFVNRDLYMCDIEVAVNTVASLYLGKLKSLLTINVKNHNGKDFIILRSQVR